MTKKISNKKNMIKMKRNRTRSKLKLLLLSFLLTSLIPIIFAQESPPPETPLPPEGTGCQEVWICSEWSDCINNQQTRTCTDSNNCGTTDDKPGETKDCTIKGVPEEVKPLEEIVQPNKTVEEKPAAQEAEKEEMKQTFFSSLTFKIIIVTISFLIAGIILLFVYKKKTTIPEKPSGIIEEQTITEIKSAEQPKIEEPKKEQVDPMLLEYIKTNLDKGFTKEQIKKELIKAGWDAKEIDKTLAKY